MKYTINVTEEDIKAGVQGHCELCAVAMAIRRATGRDEIYTYGMFVRTEKSADSRHIIGELPAVAIHFISEFDSGKNVKPIQFEIEIKDARE